MQNARVPRRSPPQRLRIYLYTTESRRPGTGGFGPKGNYTVLCDNLLVPAIIDVDLVESYMTVELGRGPLRVARRGEFAQVVRINVVAAWIELAQPLFASVTPPSGRQQIWLDLNQYSGAR